MLRAKAAGDPGMLRLGAVCALVGGLLVMVATLFHPELPPPREGGLQVVASNAAWSAMHLAALLGALFSLGALAVIARDLEAGTAPTSSGSLARLGLIAATLGAGCVAVEMTLDGVGLKGFADRWAAAAPSEQEQLAVVAEAVWAVVTSMYATSISLFLGVPFLLFGLATARSRHYPAWLGWFGAVGGGGLFLIGFWLFLGAPLFLLAALAILSGIPITWLLAMSWLLWRRAGRLAAATVQPMTAGGKR